MTDRRCACNCGASLAGMRAGAVYASPACRMRARRAADANKTRTRRKSRDGKGTRVYLTFGEIVHLEQARERLGLPQTSAGKRLLAKFAHAQVRIAEGQS